MKRIITYLTIPTLLFLTVAFSNPAKGAATVTYPTNSGITWYIGSSYNITWSDFTFPFVTIPYVKIEVYKGAYLYYTITSSTANDGSFNWTVPVSILPSGDYRIAVTATTYGEFVFDYSDNYFTIAPNPYVSYPSASGITWYRGSSYNITWSGFYGSSVKIELYKGSSLYYTISSSTANDGGYTWPVPVSMALASDYYIRITSLTNGNYDNSNYYFAIGERPTVLYPTASGITWYRASSYNITWTGFTGTSDVKIELYKGASVYYTISSTTTNDGAFYWTVPVSIPLASDYYIKITSTANATIYAQSIYYFTIGERPTVIYPSASGIFWRPGSTYNITWTGFTGVSYVKIDLYKGSTVYGTITSSTANDGSELWTVPASLPLDIDYYIRVTSTANTSVYDNSDYYFAVANPKVDYPSVSGIYWKVGNTYNIIWSGFPGTYVKVDLYKGASLYGTISSSTDNDGSLLWTVPAVPAATDYYVRITSTANSSIYDNSDYYFTIANPKVEYPSASGITWNVGTTYNITWSGYPGSFVKIDLYKGTTLFGVINASTANDGTHPFTVPYVPAAPDYYVRITSTANTSVYDISDYYFAVAATLNVSPASLTIGPASGSAGTFIITSNTSWNITDDADWLSVAPVSGTNNGTITVTATSANTGTTPRTATVTVAGAGVSNKTVTVTQSTATIVKALGNTTVYGSTSTTANRRAQVITFPEPGTIQSISIYHNGGTGRLLLGVYDDVSGSPGGRLGMTPDITINPTAGWQTVPLTSPVSVIAGQKVWLSWVFENNPGVRYIAGTPARAQSEATWPGGMPNPFGAATFADYKYSAYCSYVAGGPGPVTKTLGNTTVYGSTSTTANRRAQTVTFPEAGTIQSLTIYHNGGTGNVFLGVYADALVHLAAG